MPRTEQTSHPDEDIVFANEKARISWEIAAAIDRIAQTLPPEGVAARPKDIVFDPRNELRGAYVCFYAGSLHPTPEDAVYRVPERTLKILDELGIPYSPARQKRRRR